jgi:aminoglycoside 6'-N-acetyltransferase
VVDPDPCPFEALELRPLRSADAPELRRILLSEPVRRWWGAPEPGFPESDDPEAERLTILYAGAVAGMIQFAEEQHPRYRHATIDLFLDPVLHGRGLGTEALRRVLGLLVTERGHHRVTIDPARANTAAVRAYEKAGFRAIGVMRAYERDADGPEWHDGLLMEFTADPS